MDIAESARGKADQTNLTQFGWAMQPLGVAMIPAYSPEARGNVSQLHRTLRGVLYCGAHGSGNPAAAGLQVTA